MAVGGICVGASARTDVMASTGGTAAIVQRMKDWNKQSMQQPVKRIASDPQCLEFVTGTRASVASCLNTIGCNVACFMCLLADEFARATRFRAHGLWLCQPSRKKLFCNILKCSHRRPSCPSINRSWFVEVQPGFLQVLLTQTWVKCTALNSSRCAVYSGVRFKAIWAAS